MQLVFRFYLLERWDDILTRFYNDTTDDGSHVSDEGQARMLQHLVIQLAMIVDDSLEVDVTNLRQLFVEAHTRD